MLARNYGSGEIIPDAFGTCVFPESEAGRFNREILLSASGLIDVLMS